jgi:hypothetical protein
MKRLRISRLMSSSSEKFRVHEIHFTMRLWTVYPNRLTPRDDVCNNIIRYILYSRVKRSNLLTTTDFKAHLTHCHVLIRHFQRMSQANYLYNLRSAAGEDATWFTPTGRDTISRPR